MSSQFLQVYFHTPELRAVLAQRGARGIVFRPILDPNDQLITLRAEAAFLRGVYPPRDALVVEGTPNEPANNYFEFYNEYFPEGKNMNFVLFFRDQMEMAFSYQEKYFMLSGTEINYGGAGILNGSRFTLKGEPNSRRMENLMAPIPEDDERSPIQIINELKRDLVKAILERGMISSYTDPGSLQEQFLNGEDSDSGEGENLLHLGIGNAITMLGHHCPPTWDGDG